MENTNYRKITVGQSFSNCIAYVKGASYLSRSVKITDIILDEVGDEFKIYVVSNKEDKSGKVLWKRIPNSPNSILEKEHDLNFD
jgi:hypothetical protein